ncbi:DUF5067 domain-containing protein [Levilactobacillus enshiensis]|uniref:DUF5067 domain-containing protein n=1 Tax=Levilactobacillus enshiensis TaxID=2590213 RepID=UPI00117BCC2C|nr:DUF5067 domain-containing protein [Levilactobacillus enshiensis]
MKHIIVKSLLITSMVVGSSIPANNVFAKKHSLKTQHLSSLTFNNYQMKGKGTKGSKISVYHGKNKLGSTTIKKSKFTFKWSKLKTVKNNWKLKISATKKGYKKATVNMTVFVSSAKTKTPKATSTVTKIVQPVKKTAYLSGSTLYTEEGNITFANSVRESDGVDGTNLLVFMTYTNTTNKMQDLSSIVYYDCTPTQNLGAITKELDISSVDIDSQYYDMAQVIDGEEYVNPGQTVSTVAAWTLDNPTTPVKIDLQAPSVYKSLGSISY